MKLTDLKEGDLIKGFEGFGCIPNSDIREVHLDQGGLAWVLCDMGLHYLDGQEDENGELTGLSKVGNAYDGI